MSDYSKICKHGYPDAGRACVQCKFAPYPVIDKLNEANAELHRLRAENERLKRDLLAAKYPRVTDRDWQALTDVALKNLESAQRLGDQLAELEKMRTDRWRDLARELAHRLRGHMGRTTDGSYAPNCDAWTSDDHDALDRVRAALAEEGR